MDGENKVNIRTVTPGDRAGSDWIISNGLKAGRARGGRGRAEGASRIASKPETVCGAKRDGGGKVRPMSKFFINRPIVAIVISIVMVILGTITIVSLPVAQFPNIAPPEIQIQATYVGADAQTLEQSVATPIEQQMSGVDHMNYMYSLNATANGGMTMIVDFDVKTDPNTDQILAQSERTQAASQLPADVNELRNHGAEIGDIAADADDVVLAERNVRRGVPFQFRLHQYSRSADAFHGIGNVQIFGAGQYAMSLWVKPDQLGKLGITVTDIINAIQAQNTVNPAGQLGGEPVPKGQEYTYAVRAQGRLISEDEFGQIVVRETPDGGVVRVKDVARVELGSQDYAVMGRLNGKPGAIIAVYQLPGSNAVDAANGVNKLIAGMKQTFPQDVDYVISLDTTKAVTSGIKEIVETLLIAIVLVILVVYIFLQSWRATLIPMLAVPVALDRNICLFPAVRIFGQHAFSIGACAGHWIGGGRRNRGRGRRRAAYRGRPLP